MTQEKLEIQDIHGTDWDYLIILDACRYDYFKDNHEDFLTGELKKVQSRGSATPEWLKETFTSRTRYNYISANPYINNQGLKLNKLVKSIDQEWDAREKFQNITDSWEKDWDEETGTVHPEKLTKTALENLQNKTIIHYIQPHRPYISADTHEHTWQPKNQLDQKTETRKRKLAEKTRTLWQPFFQKLPYTIQSKIKKTLNMGNNFEKLVQQIGSDQVKNYYEQDLRLALKNVSELVEEIDGKIIVTADHGELLGEKGWGHYIGGTEPQLLHVPWLEIQREEK